MCSMCEAHINDVVRNSVSVKKDNSSHTKNQIAIISDNDIDKLYLIHY